MVFVRINKEKISPSPYTSYELINKWRAREEAVMHKQFPSPWYSTVQKKKLLQLRLFFIAPIRF